MELIIEEINRGHKLIGRQRFSQATINIGRGYQSDIILSDPHVCPNHLTIEFDGEHWLVKDNNSINGSFLGEGKKVADGHRLSSGDVITLGKSQIRVVFPHHPVAESITLSPFEDLINLAKHPVALAANICLFALITGWLIYLGNPREVNFTQLLVPTVGTTIMLAIWPALVALISHLTKHDARAFTQLGICFVFFNLTLLSDFIEAIVKFNTSSHMPLAALITILPIAIAFCMFWLNCYVGFHMSKKKRIVVAGTLTSLLFGGSFLIQMSKQPEFTTKPKFDTTLMTPSFLFTPASSVDTFVEQSAKLFEQADKEAKEAKEKKD